MSGVALNGWALWVFVAVIAGILEVLLPYFTFSFASFAALVAAAVALRFGLEIQMVAFSATLVLTLFFARPFFISKFHTSRKMPSRSQALLGLKGEVTETIDPLKQTGRVRVGGEDWSARSESAIALGHPVEVISADGIVLIVKEI